MAALTAGLIWLGAAEGATANTYVATKTADEGAKSLRAAVKKANQRDGDDKVVLRPKRGEGKVFTLRKCGPLDAEDDLNAGGDLDHTDADSKLTIVGRNNTIRTGCDGERLIHTAGGGDLAVSKLKLTGGDSLLSGGAIQAEALRVSRSRITANTAVNGGGALAVSSGVNLSKTLLRGNRVTAGDGGAINTSGGGTVVDSKLIGNRAANGGAIRKGSGELLIARSTLSGNVAAEFGGAIDLSFDTTTIVDSTISGNEASTGGAISKAFSPLNITNSTITGNQGSPAISSSFDGGTLTAVTVTANEGTGVFTSFDTFALRASIVAGNSGASQCSAVTSLGFNITSDASCGAAEGDQPNTNPLLFGLANNGGPTRTQALRPGSPALDEGPPTDAVGCLPADQRGAPRSGRCDVGAYEQVRCEGAIVNRVGTNRRDTLRGTSGKDGLLGLGGADTLIGKDGKDGLCGGPGRDRLDGGPGRDRCDGGPGRDRATACERTTSIP